jgi:preprotein translocase subunit YajC
MFKIITIFGMSVFSNFALAQEAAAAPVTPVGGFLVNLPIILAVIGLFYFGIIRPQKQQQKQHVEFLSKLNRGDEVVTASGIIGKIVGITDRVVTLEVAPKFELKVLRSQVQAFLKDSVQADLQKA